MNLTDDDILRFQKGQPTLFEDICIIRSVTIGEIVEIGYSTFQKYLGIITTSKPVEKIKDVELNNLLNDLSDLQYILMIASIDPQINTLLKQAFQFFTNEKVIFSVNPAQIIIGSKENRHILTEDKFYDLQKIIRRIYWLELEGQQIQISKEDNWAVRRIKQNLKASRQKVRKAKAKKANTQGKELKFSDLIGSLSLNNCNLNMENIWNITYYAFQDQLKRMGWRDQFLINNQAALAGAKIDKKDMKHWIRSIADAE